MAEAVIGLLKKSVSLIAEGAWPELKSFPSVHEEVQKLESTLGDIQAVLEDAEKRKVTEAAVKRWLDELKEAAYDMDNQLDELETAIIKSKIQEEEEKAETTSVTAKVWSCISCLSGLFFKLKELVHRRGIAHKIKKLYEKLDEIANKKDRYTFQLGSISNNEVVERPITTSLVDVSDIIGREMHRDNLVRNLLGKGRENERNPYVISIVGMGGVGKTTLAKLAYNDPMVLAHFETKFWVCVSEHFDQCRVAKAIIEAGGRSTNFVGLQSLLREIRGLILGKKFLLVLDDMWTDSFTDWEPFNLVFKHGTQGSRILITTRDESVTRMVHSDYTISLEALSNEDCWLMLSKLAFVDKDENQREELSDLGRELANKCKGLPLAVKTLGSLMGNKRSKQHWKNILDSNLWGLKEVETGLLGPLLLSYHEQPLAIKSCFLYCALFPKDYLFSRNELIHLWMSQGYLGENPDIEMENIGEEYFEILVMHSFFQDFERDSDDDKIIKCKMHDIVHDLAQLMTGNECFTIDGDEELGINCKNARHLNLVLRGETQLLMSMYNAKNLRTLFFTTSRTVFPLNLFEHLTCLRALTLKYSYFEKLPNDVEKLIHLRLLDLSNSYEITELPETICNLCNLQTLNISRCIKITKLPEGMGKLIRLRHLIIDSCFNLTKPFPKGIGRLSSLRTLAKFIIGGIDDSEGCKLGELKNLNHVKGSLMIEGMRNVTDVQEAENAQIKCKKHLRELGLSFYREVVEIESVRIDEIVLNALEPHSNLESLMIDHYMGRVYPNWMMSLLNLKRLKLLICLNLERLPPIGKLLLLESLHIEDVEGVKKVGVEFLGIEEKGSITSSSSLVLFPNLKSLTFSFMNEWEEWDGIGGTMREEAQESGVTITIMPHLQNLQIEYCPKLKSLPDFLPTTPLKTLNIDGSPILSESCKTEIGDQWPKISHIPNIKTDFTYVRRDGRPMQN